MAVHGDYHAGAKKAKALSVPLEPKVKKKIFPFPEESFS
jgi:hypothetical protein